jgi:bHLH factor
LKLASELQTRRKAITSYSKLQRKSWGQYASATFGNIDSMIDTTAVATTGDSIYDHMAATNNKRKRGSLEQQDSGRQAPGAVAADAPELTQYEDGGLSQLIAHNNAEGHMNGGNPNQSATDTATAALAYTHGLPDLQFTTQTTADNNDGAFQGGASFSLDALKDGSQGANPTQVSPTSAPSSATKPPVGSDEWHKVRRDNHKEGNTPTTFFLVHTYCSLD